MCGIQLQRVGHEYIFGDSTSVDMGVRRQRGQMKYGSSSVIGMASFCEARTTR